jgi:aspartate-semialdehyde dehydrogenase
MPKSESSNWLGSLDEIIKLAKLQRVTKSLSIALVGAETLLGREVQEVLKGRVHDVAMHLFSASGEGNFGEEEGEAVYLEPLTVEQLKSSEAAIVTGSREGAKKTYDLAKAAGRTPLVIDCTGYLEDQPEIRILSPLTEEWDLHQGSVFEIAHPAASALALVLGRLAAYADIRQTVAHVFEPVSERGKRGIAELQRQTTSLLSFKPLDKEVFDTQVSFNMLSQYGEEAPTKLASVEQRIARHLTTLLSRQSANRQIPGPSLRVVHAPVFHGYSISLWVEFETSVNAIGAREALASAQIEVRGAEENAPDNVGCASQSGLSAGDIRVDENNPRGLWLWIVGDNLRLTADAVSDVISSLVARPQ